MKLKNTFKWSHTKRKNFEKCKRLYFLQHYAFWGGWEGEADSFTRLCYRLSKIQNLDMWGGHIVHDQIETILRDLRIGRRSEFEVVRERTIDRLRTDWVKSRDRHWLKSPKWNLNLFEHYYEVPIPRERADALKENVLGCLEHFLRSEALSEVMTVPTEKWRTLEQFQQFSVDGFEVVLKMDFAFELDEGVCIYDWKTGKEWRGDSEQLECYALYAREQWQYTSKRIKVRPFYLREGLVKELPCDDKVLDLKARAIVGQCMEMRSLLVDPDRNLARIDDFPMVDDPGTCRHCFFHEACYGTRALQ